MDRYFLMFCDEVGKIKPIKPIYILKEEDIDNEEGEIYINGKDVFIPTENTNFYGNGGDSQNPQAGDLVFECMNELALYRPGMNAPAGFMDTDAIVGTKEELKNYRSEYLNENVIRLNESALRKIIKESVKKVLKEGYWSEDVAEQMWYQVLEWRKNGWITDDEAEEIREIIGA